MKLIEKKDSVFDFILDSKYALYFLIMNVLYCSFHLWLLLNVFVLFIFMMLMNMIVNIKIFKDNYLYFKTLIIGYCFRINKESNRILFINNKLKKDYVNISDIIEFDLISVYDFYNKSQKFLYKKVFFITSYGGIRLYINDNSVKDMYIKISRKNYDKTIESLEQFFPNREKRLKQEMAK